MSIDGVRPKKYMNCRSFKFKMSHFLHSLSLSVSLFISGLPQYLVSEAEDTDYTEGEEESGQTGVEEADSH